MNLLELYKLNKYITDKETLHCYISEFYNYLFTPHKKENIKILEIGIKYGGSIQMWRDFFINGDVYGIDSGDEFITFVPHCKIIEGDAYDTQIVNLLPDEFDFIIDDGPHSLESQLKFVSLYGNKIKKGGSLIIEDIQTEDDLHQIINNINRDKFSYEILDFREIKDRYDDIIIHIIKK
jgi:cephalosporin hydroxylase